ncbi:hypothetical protein [Rugosibacter aromaticivorans]|uniref:hypothetical protein n=1 Tax=Rugosibacter aromaticivorans TaxID=1565605 RepID=UPI001229FE1C|nr:hypothetical protein [Rugosibacter aromaticivorans]TBR15344.1 MAG: hypothetical protein EPO43_04375 [Rugosibacter sp.]
MEPNILLFHMIFGKPADYSAQRWPGQTQLDKTDQLSVGFYERGIEIKATSENACAIYAKSIFYARTLGGSENSGNSENVENSQATGAGVFS